MKAFAEIALLEILRGLCPRSSECVGAPPASWCLPRWQRQLDVVSPAISPKEHPSASRSFRETNIDPRRFTSSRDDEQIRQANRSIIIGHGDPRTWRTWRRRQLFFLPPDSGRRTEIESSASDTFHNVLRNVTLVA